MLIFASYFLDKDLRRRNLHLSIGKTSTVFPKNCGHSLLIPSSWVKHLGEKEKMYYDVFVGASVQRFSLAQHQYCFQPLVRDPCLAAGTEKE